MRQMFSVAFNFIEYFGDQYMLRNKFAIGFALLLGFVIGSQGDVFAAGKKKEAKFQEKRSKI